MMSEWTPGEEGGKSPKTIPQSGPLSIQVRSRFSREECGFWLSPHLHFGELSPIRAWNAVNNYAISEN